MSMLEFPRTEWPQESYFRPGIETANVGSRIRFAAQKASKKLARSMSSGQVSQLDGIDFTMGVLDVVLELNDQLRYEHSWEDRPRPTSVDAWHAWIRSACAEIVEVQARAELRKCSADNVGEQWDADKGEHVILACMDQLWTAADSQGSLVDPLPWTAARPFVARYVPDDEEKGMLWHGREFDRDNIRSTRPVTYTSEGK